MELLSINTLIKTRDENVAKILIVDDEETILNYLSTLLRQAKHEVFTASNGELGLELVKKIDPNLVITDYKMPYMNGVQLYLEATIINDNIPFIFLTGYGNEVTALDEAYEVVAKPPNEAKLLELVDEKVLTPEATEFQV